MSSSPPLLSTALLVQLSNAHATVRLIYDIFYHVDIGTTYIYITT